jgi:hypothetical protein
MKYMLMIYRDEAAHGAGQTGGAHSAAYVAYAQALKEAGALVGGDRLQPSATATTVRAGAGAPEILDGPYADTKEQFGGFYVIDVPDLDAALRWAALCPGAAQGAVEVRPLWVV